MEGVRGHRRAHRTRALPRLRPSVRISRRARPSRSRMADPGRSPQRVRSPRSSGQKAGTSSKSGQTTTAPSAGSAGRRGSAARGWPRCWTPEPSQTPHQPSGLLNEKWCGTSSSKLRPQPVANPVLAVAVDRPVGLVGLVADPSDMHDPLAQIKRGTDRVGQSANGSLADDRPIDHDFDPVCLRRWLSLGGSSRLTDLPSTRTRAKPRDPRSSSQSDSYDSPSRRS